MIVQASSDDIPRIIDLVQEFNDAYFDVPLDLVKTLAWIELTLQEGVIYLSPGGFIGGMPVEDPCRGWTALVEFGWYATDRSGTQLLQSFINYAAAIGVDEVRMTTLSTTPPGVETLLGRYGFSPLETSHRLLI